MFLCVSVCLCVWLCGVVCIMRRCSRREIRHQRSRRSPFDIIRVFFICLPLVVLLLVRSSVRVRLLAFLETVSSSSAFSLPRHKLSFASSVSRLVDRSVDGSACDQSRGKIWSVWSGGRSSSGHFVGQSVRSFQSSLTSAGRFIGWSVWPFDFLQTLLDLTGYSNIQCISHHSV